MIKAQNKNYIGAFTLMLIFTTTLAVAGQPRGGITRRVKFPPGRTSTVITGVAPFGKRDTYIFSARKGQIISGDVIWQGKRVAVPMIRACPVLSSLSWTVRRPQTRRTFTLRPRPPAITAWS